MDPLTFAITTFNQVKNLVKASDNPQLFAIINTLHEALLNLRAQQMDLQDEIKKLKEENAALRKAKATDDELEFFEDALFKKDKKDPYCSGCWQLNYQLINLHSINNLVFGCPICKVSVKKTHKLLGRVKS